MVYYDKLPLVFQYFEVLGLKKV